MTTRQKKESLDNGIMALKCIMLMIALCIFISGHAIISLLIAGIEIGELVFFGIRLSIERRINVLHNQRSSKSSGN